MDHTQSRDPAVADGARILQPQRNCRELCDAERVAVLRETADYFDAFARACRNARRQILILGWDFDRHERLYRDDKERELPNKLGDFLKTLVRRRPQLEVYLLTGDFSMIYAAERELLPELRVRLSAPRRLHFRLDGEHPPGASQHQKVVVIDDRLAFVGGVDLSRWRWDTGEHKPDDARRMDPDGKPYPPFHDLMFMVQGQIAARLGDLARERWRRSCGRRLPAPTEGTSDPWPSHYAAELRQLQVALARTEPAHQGRAAVREVEWLYLDAITAAEHVVYIENQYFTSHTLAGALAARLAEERGPDVVLVLPKHTGGWLEQVTMDVLRGREVARLRAADRHDRLRIYYPHQPGLGDACISVHAKLLIVDDRLLRIGSSNTSNRSMGLDTECDLALEAVGADAARTRAYIDRLRRDLLAEHLGCEPDRVAHAESEHGRLIPAIESLRDDRGRSLRPLDTDVSAEVDALVPDADVLDPSEPINPEYFLAEYVPEEGRTAGQRRLLVFLGLIVALLALAAAWRWTPMQQWLAPDQLTAWAALLPSPGARAVAVVAAIAIAALLMVPLTALAVICGIVFPGWQAFAYMMAGALISAALGFVGGQVLGNRAIERLNGSRINQLSRRLAQRGVLAVAILRLVPIAPFAVFNLVAGASHLHFRQFMLGSLLGFLPGLGAITLFSATLWEAATSPTLTNILWALGVGLVLVVLAGLIKRWLRSG